MHSPLPRVALGGLMAAALVIAGYRLGAARSDRRVDRRIELSDSALDGMRRDYARRLGHPPSREQGPATEREIAGVFGAGFAAAVFTLEAGERWQGPIASSFGLHLVRVMRREPARAASFEEARVEVARDLVEHRRAHARDVLLE